MTTLTAESDLWTPADPMCCPSGGSVLLNLDVRDDALVITGLKLVAPDAERPPR